jgi:hypothetical protein
VTWTAGGAISGNCCKGSLVRPRIPTITSRIDITVARTGLSINILNMIDKSYLVAVAIV